MKIAVMTSGGDAPGMNAAVRSVVRSACALGWETLGVLRGYEGLMRGQTRPLGARDVSGILQQGGTLLGTARSEAFKDPAGRRRAAARLKALGVSGLVVVGGNGSQQGSRALDLIGVPVVGIGSTIDNDLAGVDMSLGADTALNVILEAIDRLKNTASALDRVFLIEVMGRDFGWLALASGLAGGAEYIALPGGGTTVAGLAARIREAYRCGKTHGIVVVAEGAEPDAAALAEGLRAKRLGFDVRLTILGHVQRGGRPTGFDRMLGTRLGFAAVESLARGEHGVLVGWCGGQVARLRLSEVAGKPARLDRELLRLTDVMDR